MTGAIAIPESFTTGLTTLISNLTATLSGWIPTVLLAGLGIAAVVWFFSFIGRYARRAMRGRA